MSRRSWRALRLGGRLAACLLIVLAHRLVGGWLVGQDAISGVISVNPLVILALLLLVPLRLATWLLVPVWLVAGTAADLWEAWEQRPLDARQPPHQ